MLSCRSFGENFPDIWGGQTGPNFILIPFKRLSGPDRPLWFVSPPSGVVPNLMEFRVPFPRF